MMELVLGFGSTTGHRPLYLSRNHATLLLVCVIENLPQTSNALLRSRQLWMRRFGVLGFSVADK